jgi:hypothetical protein
MMMPSKTKILDIDYLTHSVKTSKLMGIPVHVQGKPLTIGQMFFKPYESDEFEYPYLCTTASVGVLGLTMLAYQLTIAAPIAAAVIAAVIAVNIAFEMSDWSRVNNLPENEQHGSFYLDTAEEFIRGLCQVIINLLVTPLAVFIMTTRGISTGLQAAGLYGEHNVSEDVLPPSAINA